MRNRKTLLAVTGVGAAVAMALSMPAFAGGGYGWGHSSTDITSIHKNLWDVGNSFSDSSTHLSVGNVAVNVSNTTASTNLSGTVNASGQGISGATGMGGPALSTVLLSKAHTGHASAGGTFGGDSGNFTVANSITNGANGAGIMNVAQNMGASSLIQQGVTVQANMSFNH
jgi:hypothetical protein